MPTSDGSVGRIERPCPRLLVTGASGFVGGRLASLGAAVHSKWADEWLWGTRSLGAEREASAPGRWVSLDLEQPGSLASILAEWRPTHVLHLAAVALPRAAERDPEHAERVNAQGTHALGRAAAAIGARLVFASTAQVYGRRAGVLDESLEPAPANAYGRSKWAAERALLQLASEGLDAVIARPFNHSGPGQKADYVLPAFAREIRRALESGEPARTGNLAPRRDFLHVDDVLEGYRCLLQRAPAGWTANICSGIGTPISALFDGLAQRLGLPADQRVTDPLRVRSDDPPEITGDPSRLKSLGWTPQRSLDDLLNDIARGTEVTGDPRTAAR
ncbi:MAG: NAD-dependent epimerase/dehydratase family protein [Planctomycetota bacterium]|jgi:nucleoside-diphosphate-sugar epimerase